MKKKKQYNKEDLKLFIFYQITQHDVQVLF